MKKTFNINIAGYPFTIDDDAYELLSRYLETIEHAFASNDESNEIVADIEARIAELLNDYTSAGNNIITLPTVESIIERVGMPEDFIAEEESFTYESNPSGNPGDGQHTTHATPPPYVPPVKKKLYRDPQNSMLGGVCSGLAWYLNVDPTVVRLLTVLLTIMSFSGIAIAYLVMWVVVPEARTPLQRMQMMGQQPTVESIGKTVTDNFHEQNAPCTPPVDNSFGGTLASIFGFLAKALIIIGLIIGIPVLIALIIALIGCLFSLIVFGSSAGFSFFGGNTPEWMMETGNVAIYGILCGIGCILVIGIPIFFLVWMGLNKEVSKGVRNTLLVIWAAGLIMAALATGKIISLADDDQFNNLIFEETENFSNFNGQLDSLNDQLDSISDRLDDRTNQLDSVSSQLDSIDNHRDDLSRQLEAEGWIYERPISGPR